jgi:hypothetical protein
LPPRIVPENTLHITDVFATQGTDGGGLVLVVLIIGENIYEDTFHDTVSLNGYAHIWWKKRPEIEAHVSLHNYHFTTQNEIVGRILTLDPGDKFYIKTKWYFRTDAGNSVLDYFTFEENPDNNGYLHAKPETFVIQVKATLFDQLGFMESEPIEVEIKAWKKVELDDG